MTTGEKLSLLRKKKGLTQEELSEILKVLRQSVSRWEMDATFPETDKLITLSKLFGCSIDFLLNDSIQEIRESDSETSVADCYQFIRDCGFFFLATSVDNQPKVRPLGMIYSNGKELLIATDKRKNIYSDLMSNSQLEIATYNLHTRRWIRISGKAEIENSIHIKEEMMNAYPLLKQKYLNESEMYFVIFKILIDHIEIA